MWEHNLLIRWLNIENVREIELRKEDAWRWLRRPFSSVVGHGQSIWIGNYEWEET